MFHGVPFSSHQWKALVVLRISRYSDRASFRVVDDLKNLAVRIVDGRIIVGAMVDGLLIVWFVGLLVCCLVCWLVG